MKNILRVICFIILLALPVPLASCGGGDGGEDTGDVTPAISESETPAAVTTTAATSAPYVRPILPGVSLSLIPDFSGGAAPRDYDCGDGEFMRYVPGILKKDYDAYLGALAAAGFSELSSAKIGANYFASYVRDGARVYVYHIQNDAAARIIVSPYDPAADGRVNNIDFGMGEVLLTQVGINYSSVVNGMSYILRTPTGSFIVIDGGWAGQGEAKRILDLLNEQNENGGKPNVAAWILTHPHSDHIGAISEFSAMYYKEVELRRIIWNFPSDATMAASDSVKMITEPNSYYAKIRKAINDPAVWGGVELVKVHTGGALTFDGVSMTVLETHEDIYPNTEALEFMNAASMAFMLEAAGNRMLFLGDCTATCTNQINNRFGTWLKCDYLQPTHHGSTGGNLNLYKNAAPAVTLWCSSIPRFEEYKNSDFNKWLLANCPEHYYSGNGTVTLTLKPKG